MAKKTLHKYHKVAIGASEVFSCALPDCNHFQPRHLNNLLIGRKAICWDCEQPFVIASHNLAQERMTCNDCLVGDVLDMIQIGGIK